MDSNVTLETPYGVNGKRPESSVERLQLFVTGNCNWSPMTQDAFP